VTRPNLSLGTIFRTPLVLACLSLIGLLGALLADGAWDLVGAGLLMIVIGTIVWARSGPRR
tara:strand:- start:108 stop:290 length:183 start_codon:yes stop_codon:yes gene_type:complete